MNDPGEAVETRVFERDGYRCRNCGESDQDANTLEPYAIDDRATPESLVTTCTSCHALLSGGVPAWRRTVVTDVEGGLFSLLKTVTGTQGTAVGDVAGFATETTAGIDGDARDRYRADRRQIRLALRVVERHLTALETICEESGYPARARQNNGTVDDSGESLPPPELGRLLGPSLATVSELATTLQAHLQQVMSLAETAVVADGHCHVCLEPIEVESTVDGPNASRPCPSCRNPIRPVDEWIDEDGAIALAPLYRAISTELEDASETTSRLTEHSGTLAEALVE